LEIPAQPFLARLAERRGLSAKLLASLARWQRRMLSEIAELKGRSPVQRLGLFLLAQIQGEEAEAALTLPVTKVQLASRIGITPESLSRALARLRPLGVSSSGREFIIADPRKLRQFCGTD
jgi:CRP-like cAMP-binding protein